MKFGGATVYVDDVPAVLDFYRRAFFKTRFSEFQPAGAAAAAELGRSEIRAVFPATDRMTLL